LQNKDLERRLIKGATAEKQHRKEKEKEKERRFAAQGRKKEAIKHRKTYKRTRKKIK